MIGQSCGKTSLPVTEGVGPDGIDIAFLLNVIQYSVHPFIHPPETTNLNGDEVLAVIDRSAAVTAPCRPRRSFLSVALAADKRCGCRAQPEKTSTIQNRTHEQGLLG
jgi:hypothetical protein